MTRYAARTEVTADKSRLEIQRTLQRFGAESFMYGWQPGVAIIAFVKNRRQIRFQLPMPDRNSPEFTRTPTGLDRSPTAADREYDLSVRASWRALALMIKAKLAAVEAGITSFEDEFLAHTVIASGATVSDWLQPQITESYDTGGMPPMLPQPRAAIETVYDAEVVQ